LPVLSKHLVDQATVFADRLARTVDKGLKFDLEHSFPRFLRRLKGVGADERLLKDPDFMAALVYRVQTREPYIGGIKGLFQAVLRESRLKKPFFQEVRASLIRFAIQLDQPDGIVTPERVEKFDNCSRFQLAHKMNQLLDGLTARQIINLAYPPEPLQGPPLIRRSRINNGSGYCKEKTERELALILIDEGAISISAGKATVHPEVFSMLAWGRIIRRPGLDEGIKAHPDIQGCIRTALAVGARVLRIQELFGEKPGQVPPFAITSNDMWRSECNGKPMIWYLAQVVFREVRRKYPHLCCATPTKGVRLVPRSALEVPWTSEIDAVAQGVLHKQGVSVFDVIASGDPNFFGTEGGRILPVELPFRGVRTLEEMRARLAIGFYRTGLGSVVEKEGRLLWQLRAQDAIPWFSSVDANFGKNLISPMRGSLRMFKGESVGSALALLFTASAQVPAPFSKFSKHHIFRSGMTYFLQKLPGDGLWIDLCFEGNRGDPAADYLTPSIADTVAQISGPPLLLNGEQSYLYYSKFTVAHNRFPKSATELEVFVQQETKHFGPVRFEGASLMFDSEAATPGAEVL
jgi:hypothetical protein